jgi:ribosome-binding protein aMBF1 (putative translation factor)
MSVCEVCGIADEEEEQASSEISMSILHVCDACRADRQAAGTAAVDTED